MTPKRSTLVQSVTPKCSHCVRSIMNLLLRGWYPPDYLALTMEERNILKERRKAVDKAWQERETENNIPQRNTNDNSPETFGDLFNNSNSKEYSDSNEEIVAAGEKGEENVEYQLKWLGSKFYSLRKDTPEIRIKNADFIDEAQQIDHIIISPHAIYLIETKNYKGEIEINENGNWIRKTEEGIKAETNPSGQVYRHHKIIESILISEGIAAPIEDIICIANDSAIITGSINSNIPILKHDTLCEYIENKDREHNDDKIDQNKIIRTIKKYIV